MSAVAQPYRMDTQRVDIERMPSLDVWLRFDSPDDEEASAEANTWQLDSDMGRPVFAVGWSLTAVGLVTWARFHTYEDARAWLEAEGFEDYSS